MTKNTINNNKNKKLIEVGIICYRDKNGNFVDTKPLFKESTPELEQAKAKMMQDAVDMFVDDLMAYAAKKEQRQEKISDNQ